MVELQCVVYHAGVRALSVRVNATDTVDDLKTAINNAVKTYADFPEWEVGLYQAKKGETWLTEIEAKHLWRTEGLQHLDDGAATLDSIGLREEAVHRQLNGEPDAAGPSRADVVARVNLVGELPHLPPTQIFLMNSPALDGIDLDLPHLPRAAMVEKLYNVITQASFVSLATPKGYGKTALMTLMAHRHPEFRYVPISFTSCQICESAGTAVLANHGIDLVNKTCSIPLDRPCVVMLDTTERLFWDDAFWTSLLEVAPTWLPPHVHVVVSATIYPKDMQLPKLVGRIPRKMTKADLEMTDDEAHEYFKVASRWPVKWQFPSVVEKLIRSADGRIGYLGAFSYTLWRVCSTFKNPTEEKMLRLLSDMGACIFNNDA